MPKPVYEVGYYLAYSLYKKLGEEVTHPSVFMVSKSFVQFLNSNCDNAEQEQQFKNGYREGWKATHERK